MPRRSGSTAEGGRSGLWRRAVAAVFASLAAVAPLGAQAVSGVFIEEGSDQPVAGAVVVLLDHGGAVVRSTLTDEDGAFRLVAGAPGDYRLRGERIGYASAMSPPLTLDGSAERTYHLVAPATAVELVGVTARVDRREGACRVRPEEGLQVHTLWEEARKALHAAAVARKQEALQYEVTIYERMLEPRRLTVQSESRRSRSEYAAHPFATRLAPEKLSEDGYVQTVGQDTIFHAPDADVLLSAEFLDDHCLSMQEPPRDRPGLVGVAFQPLGDRTQTDIRGVLWLDAATAELRTLDFHYTRLPWTIPEEKLGGHVEFERLPNRLWIVRRWWIRMPEVRVTARPESRLPGGKLAYRQESLVGIKEQGGEVTDVTSRQHRLYATSRATLTGVVWDSTRAAPLPGATVYISGTQHSARADADGRFALPDLPAGVYTLGFMHDRLSRLNVLPAPMQVEISAGEPVDVVLAVPHVADLAAADIAEVAAIGESAPNLVAGGGADSGARNRLRAGASFRNRRGRRWKPPARGARAPHR